MKRIHLKSLAAGALLGAALVLGVAATTGNAERLPLEYRIVTGDLYGGTFQNALNRASAEGWHFEQTGPAADRHAYAVMSKPKW